jgi:hypothetical protein
MLAVHRRSGVGVAVRGRREVKRATGLAVGVGEVHGLERVEIVGGCRWVIGISASDEAKWDIGHGPRWG